MPLLWPGCIRRRCPTDIDVPVEILELNLLPAAVDLSAHGLVDYDLEASAFTLSLDRRLSGRALIELYIEVAEHVSAIGSHDDVRLHVGREGHVDVAVERAERHRLLRVDAIERHEDLAVQRMRDGIAGHVL